MTDAMAKPGCCSGQARPFDGSENLTNHEKPGTIVLQNSIVVETATNFARLWGERPLGCNEDKGPRKWECLLHPYPTLSFSGFQ